MTTAHDLEQLSSERLTWQHKVRQPEINCFQRCIVSLGRVQEVLQRGQCEKDQQQVLVQWRGKKPETTIGHQQLSSLLWTLCVTIEKSCLRRLPAVTWRTILGRWPPYEKGGCFRKGELSDCFPAMSSWMTEHKPGRTRSRQGIWQGITMQSPAPVSMPTECSCAFLSACSACNGVWPPAFQAAFHYESLEKFPLLVSAVTHSFLYSTLASPRHLGETNLETVWLTSGFRSLCTTPCKWHQATTPRI